MLLNLEGDVPTTSVPDQSFKFVKKSELRNKKERQEKIQEQLGYYYILDDDVGTKEIISHFR